MKREKRVCGEASRICRFRPVHPRMTPACMMPDLRRLFPAVLAVLSLLHMRAGAWVYPEHRQITISGILQLTPERRNQLQSLWTEARAGREARLSPALVDSSGSMDVSSLDYGAWPAIAGDHSCSPAEMLGTILESSWILDVATVAARLEQELGRAGLERYRRTNALRDSDLRLQAADPAYVTRAGSNNVHFLLSRPYAETDEKSYVETCLGSGCEPNALGAWAWYHLKALEKTSALAQAGLSPSERSTLALAALADEAYALHFLEDTFAAGHVAGTRGSASERKGTHDYYNEHGLETRTWAGKTLVLKGDAWMRPEDAERAGAAVRASLEQVLDAATAGSTFPARSTGATADTLNTCTFDAMPGGEIPAGSSVLLARIIHFTPVPGLAEGEGELPRFRAEVGPFIGVVPAMRLGAAFGGFSTQQSKTAAVGGLELAVRVGLGLDGVMNESGDGLVFFDLGFRLDGAASTSIAEDEGVQAFGAIFSSIPSRSAITTRLRMPFWLLPLDLLFTAPFLIPAAPETFASMAVRAGNGGVLPWQTGIATSFGRFQFILGREFGASFYGYPGGGDRMLFLGGDPGQEYVLLATFRSVYLEFPVVEYMPFRTFSADEGSSLVIQLYGGVDIPTSVSEVFPDGLPDPRTESIWQIGLRAAFRWRHYF